MKIRSITFAIAASLLVSAPADADLSQYEIKPDVVYGHKLGMALTLDVIKPKANSNGAGILFMVSGGWVSGWMPPENAIGGDFGKRLGFTQMLDKGYTLFLVRHGSSPRFKVPECVGDVRRAVRFVRRQAADWAIDPARLGVFGASAGGHLSLMLGTTGDDGSPDAKDPVEKTSDRVAAVVAIFPPSELKTFLESEEYRRNFPALQFDAADWKGVSPLEHVTRDDAPTLLFHGGKDTLVPDKHSREMLAALQKTGVEADLILFPEAGHGFDGADRDRTVAATVAWFEKHLATTKPLDLAGVWKARASLPDGGEYQSTFTFTRSGAGWTGMVESEHGKRDVNKTGVEKRKVSIEVEFERDGETTQIRIEADAENANKLLGQWSMHKTGEETARGRWEAAREAKATEPTPRGNALAGEWELEMKMGDDTRDYTLKFEPDGSGMKGTLVSPRSGDHPVESAALDNNKLKLRIKRNFNGTDVIMVFTGRLENGALSGKIVAEGFEDQFSGEWTAKKK